MHLQRGCCSAKLNQINYKGAKFVVSITYCFSIEMRRKTTELQNYTPFQDSTATGVIATRRPVSPFPALAIPRLCSFCSFCSFRTNTLLNQQHTQNYKTDYKTHCVVTAKPLKHIGPAAKCYSFF